MRESNFSPMSLAYLKRSMCYFPWGAPDSASTRTRPSVTILGPSAPRAVCLSGKLLVIPAYL